MPINLGNKKIKLYKGNQKVKKVYLGNRLVYSAGNIVTYYVDSGVTYQEEVDEGESCLSPKTFTPAKSGWEFVGWRSDATLNPDVYTSYVMGDNPVRLYAIFKQAVSVTYYNNSTTASSTSGYRYYNNGNTVNPSFALTQAGSSGWTARGWSTSNSGNADITYANGASFTRDSNVTLYGLYQQTITVTYYNNSTTASTTTGTRYWAPAGYINPSFTLTQSSRSGWTARGWSTSNAGNGSISYSNATAFARDSNITLYGCYQQTITVTYYNNSTSASTSTGTRYYNSSGNTVNPSFTLTQATRSEWTARGWSTGTAGNGVISYNNGAAFTRDSNVTLYGMYQQTITLTYYNGSTTASTTSGTRYYNSGSGNATNPTFSLTPATLSGWTFRGWATSSAAAAGITYSSISGTAFSASATVYATYSQAITLSYNGNGNTGGSTAAQTGTRYFNTGNYSNPSFTLAANGFSKTSYAFSNWALGSASGTQYAAGASVTLSANTTMYAVWTYVGAPFYIVSNYGCVQTLDWTLRKDLGFDNILDYTFVAANFTAGSSYPAIQCYKEDDDLNGYFYVVSSSIQTNGNKTLAIEARTATGDTDACKITVNGVTKGIPDSVTVTFDITGKSSITITARIFSWGLGFYPYMQFVNLRLY